MQPSTAQQSMMFFSKRIMMHRVNWLSYHTMKHHFAGEIKLHILMTLLTSNQDLTAKEEVRTFPGIISSKNLIPEMKTGETVC
jgi:hypothetical protein